MLVERTNGKTISNKKCRFRHFARIVSSLILVMPVIFIMAYVWLVPRVIRREVERGLSEFFEGAVEIESVEVNHSGQVTLRGIQFCDKAKRQWLFAEKVKANLANWPGLSPKIAEIEVDGLNLQFFIADGKFITLPVRLPQRSASPKNRFDFRKLSVSNAAVSIVDAQSSKTVYDDLTLSAIRIVNGDYEFSLNRMSGDSSEIFLAGGTVNLKNSNFDVSLQVEHRFTKAEMTLAFVALNMPELSAEGSLSADLSITGCLKKPAEWQPKGTLRLRHWLVEADGAVAWSALNTDLEVKSYGFGLDKLSICDSNGVEWISTNNAKVSLMNWPGLKPVITEIEIEAPKLQTLFADGGKFTIPAWLPKVGTTGSTAGFSELQRLAIRDAAIVIESSGGSRVVFDRLWLDAVKQEDSYDVSMRRRAADDSNAVYIKGLVNPKTLDFDLSLKVEDKIEKPETHLLFDSMNISQFSAEGVVSADLTIMGCMKKPIRLQPAGTVILSDWTIEAENEKISSGFNTIVEISTQGISLESLAICDANGLEWFSAESAKLTFEDWPGFRPVLTEVEAKGLTLRTYLADGKLCLPVQFSSKESTSLTSSYLNLQRLVLHNASIGIVGRPNAKITCDYLSLQPDRQEGFYDVLLTLSRPQQQEPSKVRLQGVINPTSSEVRLSLEIDYRAKRQETAVAFAALGIPQLSAEGKVAGDLTIAGCLNEPLGLQPSGSVRLDECVLFFKEEVLADNLVTTAKLHGRRLDLDRFSAVVCKGRVSGSFLAEVKENRLMEFRGRVLAVNVNFPEFTSVLTAKAKKATKGTFTGSYNFSGQHNGLNVINGEGLIFFDDADVSVLPVIPTIFRFAGLSQYEPLKMSDAEAIFSTTGPVVTIQTGHISNRFAAIEFEPGGTVNLQAKQIDGHVIFAPISQIAGAIKQLPVINIFARLKDKLMRLHVKGDWSDPPSKLIKKEPIRDLKDSTISFIQDVVKSGGQFSRDMLNRLSRLLKTNENKSK